MAHWTLDDIPWERFERSKASQDVINIVKAASLVEHRADDYVTYLCRVFGDDPRFQADMRNWGAEEVQHGRALRRWAEMADPAFDFETSFARFTNGVPLALDATKSIRGSRAGELVARCMVEVGTSSFYSAVRDASEEPVLREICRLIARDEFRHYKLFYAYLPHYLEAEGLGWFGRLRVALARMQETEDDELAYAYYCGTNAKGSYRRSEFSRAYARRAFDLYGFAQVRKAVRMILRTVGLNDQGLLSRFLAGAVYGVLRSRARMPLRAA